MTDERGSRHEALVPKEGGGGGGSGGNVALLGLAVVSVVSVVCASCPPHPKARVVISIPPFAGVGRILFKIYLYSIVSTFGVNIFMYPNIEEVLNFLFSVKIGDLSLPLP